ncbi:type II secretion system F family protein [Pseudaestuariivita atlantica]|uniref:Pilus assembly protein TadC n=1 Tax=Pseudaestuariivita atlantica TaxID=1317121 RepID=A0A0L1JTR3_9RHOB|nr:type II secretion system F family protein [Pseudaestuariivita atlantica]KNG94803.1 pilus assembly protein TadC [Pseudaestuariivita atlantica]
MELVTDILGPFGPIILVGSLGVLLVLLTIPMMMRDKSDPMQKLHRQSQARHKSADQGPTLRSNQQNKKLEKYATFLEPQDTEEYSAIRKTLVTAGYRTKDAVRIYFAAQMVLGLGGLALGAAYFFLVIKSDETTMQQTLMYILGPGAGGYLFPKYWLTKRVDKRKKEIEQGFPDSLDMMLVCIEAGQSMDQAIIRVARELHASYPALADEYEIVAHEIKAGKDKSAVLRDMAERCGVQDIASFTTVLIQSQQFGTSIGEALRVYAEEMRDKRVMRAEEAANKLPTKMTLVTMTLTVPPLLIILVGPSAVGITQLGQLAN